MPNRTKEAGAIVHLVEELGDARLRCDQLVAYVAEALRLIENSPHKDHFFEVAGHILYAAPLTLQKLQKSLQAVALAANQIDSEELKNDLRPEKVQQIEQALENVRIRQIRRRSEPTMMITPQYVAEKLRQFAATTREAQLPQSDVAEFIVELEGGKKVGSERIPEADMLERFAQVAEKGNSDYVRLAAILRRMIGDTHVRGTLAALDSSKTAWADDFPKLNERAILIARALDSIKENGKELLKEMERVRNTPMTTDVTVRGLTDLVKAATRARQEMFGWGARSFNKLEKLASAEAWKVGSDDDKQSRFEEGKPADPTENMSPEDAEKWKKQNEEHRDKFKTADALHWKAGGAGMAPKFDPSFQQQLSLMMRNPPKVSQVEGMSVIEIFSPFVKKYIPQAEYTSAEAAQKDLNVWMKAHRETIQNLRGVIRDEDKTASVLEPEAWKADNAK